MSRFVEQIQEAAEQELYRLSDLYSDDVARQMRAGALAILDLHKPNESGNGCVICSRVESCGCVSAADLANCSKYDWPCATVVALGAMFGVEYVAPPTPEPGGVWPDTISFEQLARAWWEQTFRDSIAAMDAEIVTAARMPRTVLGGFEVGAMVKPRAALDPDVARLAQESVGGKPARVRRPGDDTVEISMENDFLSDRVKMTIRWRP